MHRENNHEEEENRNSTPKINCPRNVNSAALSSLPQLKTHTKTNGCNRLITDANYNRWKKSMGFHGLSFRMKALCLNFIYWYFTRKISQTVMIKTRLTTNHYKLIFYIHSSLEYTKSLHNDILLIFFLRFHPISSSPTLIFQKSLR